MPQAYLRALMSAYVASTYIYSQGLGGTEFDFFQFMQKRFLQH